METDRRSVLGWIAGVAACGVVARPAWAAPAAPATVITMWRDPGCGCCTEWARRIETAFGRKVRIVEASDMAAVKRLHGVPDDLRSCHTAVIDGLVIEGHVPPQDIKAQAARRVNGVKGLAVPGMPAGSPGMDVGHNHRQPYQVIAFATGGRRFVAARHG
jgi:hypothetical protein